MLCSVTNIHDPSKDLQASMEKLDEQVPDKVEITTERFCLSAETESKEEEDITCSVSITLSEAGEDAFDTDKDISERSEDNTSTHSGMLAV